MRGPGAKRLTVSVSARAQYERLQEVDGHHYDELVELFASFLDPEYLLQPRILREQRRTSETAMTRNEYAIAATRSQPGMRVLDIGGG